MYISLIFKKLTKFYFKLRTEFERRQHLEMRLRKVRRDNSSVPRSRAPPAMAMEQGQQTPVPTHIQGVTDAHNSTVWLCCPCDLLSLARPGFLCSTRDPADRSQRHGHPIC